MMNSKLMRGLFLLLVIMAPAFAFTVSPTTITDTIQVGKEKTFYITITNTEENESTYTFTKFGDLAPYIYFSASSITISPGDSENISVLVRIPEDLSEGDYTGTINITDGTSSETVSLQISVIKWLYENAFWFEEGQQITIQPFGFTFTIEDVGRDVITDKGNFSVGDSRTFLDGNIELYLMDRYENQARFRIRTTDASTTVSATKLETAETGECKLEPIISKFMNSYEEGVKTKFLWTIRNSGTMTVDLKDVIVLNTIETTEGSKPIDVQGILGKLEPGEETTLTININTEGLEYGTYTPSVTVVGYCDNIRTEATIDFSIKVIQKLKPITLRINVTGPSEVDVNQEFSIEVTGTPGLDSVTVIEPSEIQRTSLSRVGDKFIWKGKATKDGTFQITFVGYYQGMSDTQTITVKVNPIKRMVISVIPSSPEDGDTVTVVVKDITTLLPISATVKVVMKDKNTGEVISQFTYTAPFEVSANYTYCFVSSAEGYKKEERCITPRVPAPKRLEINVYPETPIEGEEIVITVTDELGEVLPEVQITIDGTRYYENPLRLTLSQGSHTITASASGYETSTKTVTVSAMPTLLAKPKSYRLGSVVFWTFSAPVPYEIRINNATVYSGRSENITLSLDTEGEYSVIVLNSEIARFTVRKTSWLTWFITIVVIGLVAGYYFYARGREITTATKKRKYYRVARMKPKIPPGSPEVETE